MDPDWKHSPHQGQRSARRGSLDDHHREPREVVDRGRCHWAACRVSGAVDTIIASLKRRCTAGVTAVRALSCRCRRHHHFGWEMRGGTREQAGRPGLLGGAHDQDDTLGEPRQT